MSHEFRFSFQVGQVPRRMVTKVAQNENTPEVLRGKFVEFDLPESMEEMPSCISLVKNTPPEDAPLLPVPDGLTRCPVCGEYRGVMALKDVSDPEGLHRDKNPDTPLRVQCICGGVLCPRCKVNKFHRPTSNVWTERGGFAHVPALRACFPCDDCNAKREAEAAALRRQRIAERPKRLEEMRRRAQS